MQKKRVGEEQKAIRETSVSETTTFPLEMWPLAEPCEDNFIKGAEIKSDPADTEAKAKENLAKKVEAIMKDLEEKDVFRCKTKTCEDGNCVFDYALVGGPKCEKEPDLVTVKHQKLVRGKWTCRQELRLGCFCVKGLF